MKGSGLRLAFKVSETVRDKYIDKIKETATVDELFNLHTENHGRFLSWERCYKFFYENEAAFLSKNEEELQDLYRQAELELAFYLASFGMLRGRSVLLSKDSSVYGDLIKKLFEAKKDLKAKKDSQLNSVLYKVCDDWINDVKKTEGRKTNGDNDTLTTKILMGVFGCIPAFDRFFKVGLNLAKQADGRFEKLNTDLIDVDKWATESNSSCFIPRELANEFLKLNFHFHAPYHENDQYPLMRKIDIYFWFIGFCNYESKKDKKKSNTANQ